MSRFKFQAGDPVIYLRPRQQRGEDGEWWDRIPASYVCETAWGRSTRHKIVWREADGWQHRYVNVLSIARCAQPQKPDGA